MAADTSNTVVTLKANLSQLESLRAQLSSLRQAPAELLRPPSQTNLHLSLPDVFSNQAAISQQFANIKALTDAVGSSEAQTALRVAAESEKGTSTGVAQWRVGRGTRKPKRMPSPESPQPSMYRPSNNSPFPEVPGQMQPLTTNDLVTYVKSYNDSSKNSTSMLHIWFSSRKLASATYGKGRLPPTILLRYTIPDVLVAYISLENEGSEKRLVVESVNCFGPREQKAPHAQSDWLVFQKLTQEVSKLIRADPSVSVQQLMSLLSSHSGLFTDTCVHCRRVSSIEGHIPPVVRIWRPGPLKEDSSTFEPSGTWEARHIGCPQD